MKKLMSIICAMLTVICTASTNETADAKAAFKENFQKKYYENTGGRVVKPNSGEGKIVVYNAQSKIEEKALASILDDLTKAFGMRIEVKAGANPAFDKLDEYAKATGGAATIFLVDTATFPMSLVAFESGWGLVNLGKFGAAETAVQASRVERELARTLALTCGISYAMGTSTLMIPIRKSEALDNVELPNERGNPMITGPIHKYMLNFGVSPVTVVTYRKACVEGWAPAPTNDVQKALWDKARSEKERGPTNAIKILPNKK